MNFLSHYYVSDTRSPYYVLGVVLPDLVRMFNHSERIKVFQYPRRSRKSAPLKQINKGVKWHVEVDRWFHKTSFFNTNIKKIKNVLINGDFSYYPRFLFFVAHVMLELMLDRRLIKYNSKIGKTFYQQLRQVESRNIILYLNAQNNVQYPKEFVNKFDQFIKSQYIFDYQHNESFIAALNRVIARTGLQGFKEADFPLLEASIQKIESNYIIPSRIFKLFKEITPHASKAK